MPTLVKNQQIVIDEWTLVDETDCADSIKSIVPYREGITVSDSRGVWIEADVELEEIVDAILASPLIAVNFPVFSDGRGLSIGHLLRKRFRYEGELRAIGEVTPDLTPFMFRCGFDAFVLADDEKAKDAIRCIESLSPNYQSSAIEPEPKFRKVISDNP